ncbi:hypothetical protein Lal_00018128 [Lupinus albus]|nr:hypothetical protein Lal_00018128 [Lupinus albus]
MKPKSYSKGHTYDENKVSSISNTFTQPWHKNGKCPKGTIPIRRTTEEDILRAGSIHKFGKKEPNSIPKPISSKSLYQPPSNHEVLSLE